MAIRFTIPVQKGSPPLSSSQRFSGERMAVVASTPPATEASRARLLEGWGGRMEEATMVRRGAAACGRLAVGGVMKTLRFIAE